eukprot:GILK01003195.1.p1 GENE.GILK01003195.1~~GILK01003195.1.p1  ORF type:complete len:438 (+),score=63.17 GILK01003195.1:40-1314(+)
MASSGRGSRYSPADRLAGFDAPTVWHEFTPLAIEHNAVNLGQGFPDWETPAFLKEAMVEAMANNENQYCRSAGHRKLVDAVAARYGALMNRQINPMDEVLISVGGTEGLFLALQGLVNPGDEVIVFEPAFDIYAAQIQMAGGVVRHVPLSPVTAEDGTVQWTFDPAVLRGSFNNRTRAIIVNTPHNPTGKIFNSSELQMICDLVQSHPDVVAISDEVYEYLIYDGHAHVRLCTLPGMWDRTITISSAGKTFSCTGWKIGWLVGPKHLIQCAAIAHQWVCFSVSTPSQVAVASALERAQQEYEGFPSYFDYLCHMYKSKREKLATALREAGLKPCMPQAGFFIMADISEAPIPEAYLAPGVSRDYAFCRWLTKDIGVAAIPPTSFYCDQNKEVGANYARFAFCKSDNLLDEAAIRLSKLKSLSKN